MRILHLVKTTRGATWALRQMRELVKLDVDVHVVLPSFSGKAPDYTAAGITVHPVDLDLSLKSMVTLPRQIHGFSTIVKKIRPDLAQKILYYLENPGLAEKNALKGFEYTRELFDVKRTAREIKGIYENLI